MVPHWEYTLVFDKSSNFGTHSNRIVGIYIQFVRHIMVFQITENLIITWCFVISPCLRIANEVNYNQESNGKSWHHSKVSLQWPSLAPWLEWTEPSLHTLSLNWKHKTIFYCWKLLLVDRREGEWIVSLFRECQILKNGFVFSSFPSWIFLWIQLDSWFREEGTLLP